MNETRAIMHYILFMDAERGICACNVCQRALHARGEAGPPISLIITASDEMLNRHRTFFDSLRTTFPDDFITLARIAFMRYGRVEYASDMVTTWTLDAFKRLLADWLSVD